MSTSTPTCRASTSTAAGSRSSSASGWAACCGTTASTSLDRTPELEAAVFRIFLAQQRTTPEVALVSALLGSWSRETPPIGELAGRAREVLERVGRVPQSRYPARRRPGPQRPLPLVRPAGRRRGALEGPARACATRSRRSPRRPTPPTGHDASRRWRRSPSRRSASCASGSSRASRTGSRCWRCWHDVTTASTPCTTCARSTVVPTLRDLPCVASYSLDERPTRLVSSIGTVGELTEGSELVTSVASYVADRAAREDAVVDLYLSWPDAPTSADEMSAELRSTSGRAAARPRRTTRVRGGVLGRRRQQGRLLRLPPRR